MTDVSTKTIILIHGGNTYISYEEYLTHLHDKKVSIESLFKKDWKHTLGTTLGDSYTVLPLRMPNKDNARYLEWSIWFEKYLPLVPQDIILIGHSLGGLFLAKYLSEHTVNKTITGLFLVCPPFDADSHDNYNLTDFAITQDTLVHIGNQARHIFHYHSDDDPIVPYTESHKYQLALGIHCIHRALQGRGHIWNTDFPEIVDDIQSL